MPTRCGPSANSSRRRPRDPRSRTARYRVGELSYLTGDLPAARRALETFTAGKADHPALETAWTYLGDVRFALNDLPAARSAYERSLADHPRGRLADRARYGLARTLAAAGDRDRAVRLFRELARQRRTRNGLTAPGSRSARSSWRRAGRARPSRRWPTLERAVPESALKGEARLRRARALDRLGRSDEAGRLLRELAADPASPLAAQASLELATIELEHDRPAPALAAVDAAAQARHPLPLAAGAALPVGRGPAQAQPAG